MKIYFVRHTKPDIAPGICYGQADIGLSDNFDTEKERLKLLLPSTISAIYSSPLSRCSRFANFLTDRETVVDDRLLEIDFGAWELKPWSDIDQQQLIEWGDNFVETRIPNGENFSDVLQRTISFYNSLIELGEDTSVVVTHGGVMRAILVHLLEMPPHKAFVFNIPYGCILEVSTDGGSNCQVRWVL